MLWMSTVVQSVGMGMEFVALGWLVLELTDSAFMVGVASAARMAPFFFLGIVSGAVADRVERRLFLRWITLAGSMISGVTAIVLFRGLEQVWPVLVLTSAMGCVWAFTMTVRQAYTFDIVGPETALNGLSLTAFSQRLGGVFGALAGGFIIAKIGIDGQYLVICTAYALTAAVLLFTRESGQAAIATPDSVWRNFIGYFHLLASNRTLLLLMLLAATTEVFGFTHQSLLPVLAKDELGMGPEGLGIMGAFRQGGGMIGLLFLANLKGFRHKGMAMFVLAAGFGLGQMAFSLADDITVFIVSLVVVNACASAVDTLYKTLMQSNVSNEERGRAMGSWVLSIGIAPVGHIGIGAMASAFGAPGALLVNGSILLGVSTLTALGMPKMRRLE
ncbi:MAG: hypothetical protein CL694_12320 [Chloroflexi bacterium]|nr:hypothetical protein [Chloroflexota bacterium]HAL48505.1 hypothetical protein [Dehalococcoidia bacterium]